MGSCKLLIEGALPRLVEEDRWAFRDIVANRTYDKIEASAYPVDIVWAGWVQRCGSF